MPFYGICLWSECGPVFLITPQLFMEQQRHACWLSPRQDRDSLGPSLAPQINSFNLRENTRYLATLRAGGAASSSPRPCIEQGKEQEQTQPLKTCSMQTVERGLPATPLDQFPTISHLRQVPHKKAYLQNSSGYLAWLEELGTSQSQWKATIPILVNPGPGRG